MQGRQAKITVWSVLAPIGAITLFVALLIGANKSCLLKNNCVKESSEAASAPTYTNDLKKNTRAKVRPGDSIGVIAERFNLTVEELKACNPTVDPQRIQPGQFLKVSAIDCNGADLAPKGADPDPLSGETNAATSKGAKPPKPSENATAAADPSM